MVLQLLKADRQTDMAKLTGFVLVNFAVNEDWLR
jgi:hypothetical protein